MINRTLFISFITGLLIAGAGHAEQAKQATQQLTPAQQKQQMLQRVYQLRMRFEQDRARAENEARANVRLVTQSGAAASADSPSVTQLRQQTNQQLTRFENQFRCLDVDLQETTGNTVVICGDNSGDISGSNVSAARDIVTVTGGTP